MTDRPGAAREVGRLYEEYPYPDHGVIGTTIAGLVAPLITQANGAGLRILDAGCGTGEQTIGVARRFGEAEVVGLDLNARSIDRARLLSDRSGIDVQFQLADLSEPLDPSLGIFDVIISVGVIHHLDDPGRVLRNLRTGIQPDGHLLAMVYGSFGKSPMFLERDAIQILAGTSDRPERLRAAASIRRPAIERLLTLGLQAAYRIRFGPDIPVLEMLRRLRVGRNESFRADSYTHAHESAFTWAELGALLSENHWQRADRPPPRSGMPDHPETLFTGMALELARSLSDESLVAVFERLIRPSNLYFTAIPAGAP